MSSEFETDVVVVGAGPGGAMAARYAALEGATVTLVDKADFPRTKFCGEALSGQSVKLLHDEGLAPTLLADAKKVDSVSFSSPNNQTVASPRDDIYVISRETFDEALLNRAREAGAIFLNRTRLRSWRTEGERIVLDGNRLGDGHEVRITSRRAIIATGDPRAFATDKRQRAVRSSLAIRTYFDHYAITEAPSLHIIFDKEVMPGYGWVFPSLGGRANVGVILHNHPERTTIRQIFNRFVERNKIANRLLKGASMEAPPRGRPIYSGFGTHQLVDGSVMRVGEAAGLGFPFSGEGIFPAMASGKSAGGYAVRSLHGDGNLDQLRGYADEMRTQFSSFFRAARVLETVSGFRFIPNRMVKQAIKHPDLRELFGKILCEKHNMTEIISGRYLLRALF